MDPSDCHGLLSVYLDLDLEDEVREAALNDASVSDGMVDAFFRTLPAHRPSMALGCCTRAEVLRTWSASNVIDDRVAIAFNPNTPTETLCELATDAEDRVRAQIAFNPSADATTLQRLFDDPSLLVRDAVHVAFETELGHELRKGERKFGLDDTIDE